MNYRIPVYTFVRMSVGCSETDGINIKDNLTRITIFAKVFKCFNVLNSFMDTLREYNSICIAL